MDETDRVEDTARPLPGAGLPWHVGFQSMQRARHSQLRKSEHRHTHHELILITEGHYRARIDDHLIAARAPVAVAIGPGQRHADDCDEPVSLIAMQYKVVPGPATGGSLPLLRHEVVPAAIPLSQEHLALFERLFQALVDSEVMPPDVRIHQQDAVAEAIVWHWLALIDRRAWGPELSEHVILDDLARRLLTYFDEHARHALTLAQVAEAMGLPPRTLDWHCRRLFGTSPGQLFRRHRLMAARGHLLTTREPVQVVAERFGFPSASHFARLYRQAFGCGPKDDLGERRLG